MAAGRPPLADTLVLVADELERVRVLGLRVEGAICAMAVRASVDGGIVAELQQLDSMLQQIGALRDFVAQLSAECDHSYAIDRRRALDRVVLGDVRARLAGDVDTAEEDWEML